MPILMAAMSDRTRQDYLKSAESWLVKHLDKAGVERTPGEMTKALEVWSNGKRPATFRKMRRALSVHLHKQGLHKSADLVAKVKRIGHGEANTTKRRRCKSVTEEEHERLLADAHARKDRVMIAALWVAYHTGTRPAEMPSIQVKGIEKVSGKVILLIAGAKKNNVIGRGIDKTIAVDEPELIRHVGTLSALGRKDIDKLRLRVSRASRRLWPRRKHPPTLYSYRHQMGTDLKAREGMGRKRAAAVMGHRSQESLNEYGHKNGRRGLTRPVPIPSNQAVAKVLERPPKTIPKKGAAKKWDREMAPD